ncbi:amino acid transporter [Pseudooceanicola batsensis HTCC2597]|uniref:Amino acid transporter n=1 Tax=Pseudooceanicola batsensis (strain ATCC BAA-863 / DSM 15984 / KCTC 12145 / HTCC2597) TaxID=252305 RepID=A3U305_PSEBH|nr:APC family permease [Pseudooceanicola batsensis]EAQ01535.1 amino acid transporter [Pseudooceanicola batsensis HTCC2597]
MSAGGVTETGPEEPGADDGKLKRAIGPGLLLLFIVGDVLGTGIYALTGKVAAEVGGIVWLPFLVAFVVAALTACSYLELVTKYPKAAGAALYTEKAFGIHFVTFLVAFAVMSSGLTSSSTAARAFAENFSNGFALDLGGWAVTLIGLGFVAVIALINMRGVGESVMVNAVFTCIELTGLIIIVVIGMMVFGAGEADIAKAFDFGDREEGIFWPVIAGTTLAFFAMVGFEDSVNMAEETKRPGRTFPKMLFGGLAIAALLYLVVSIVAISIVPVDELAEGDTPLLKVVEAGAPGFPPWIFGLITMIAVGNSALINLLMASRLVYGMSEEGVLPKVLGKVNRARQTPTTAIIFTTLLAAGLITFVGAVPELGGTTALLLLGVFTVVNIAVLVLKRDKVDHPHFRTPVWVAVAGAVTCAFLVGPWTGRDPSQYTIATVLIGIGVALWVVTRLWMRRG